MITKIPEGLNVVSCSRFGTLCSNFAWAHRRIAALGRVDLLRCARDNGCPMDEATCRSAALKGHLEVRQPRGTEKGVSCQRAGEVLIPFGVGVLTRGPGDYHASRDA